MIFILGRHEVWVFMRQRTVRRVVLSEHGSVQEVNQAGEPIAEGKKEPSKPAENDQSPKVSLQEVSPWEGKTW